MPILLAHGASDRFVDPANMDILFEQANPEHVQRLLLNDCRHSDILQHHLFFGKVRAFFSKTSNRKYLESNDELRMKYDDTNQFRSLPISPS